MELNAITYGHPITEAGPAARTAEERGFDCWLTSEVGYDPFLTVTAAALATERIELGTAIAVAFARNPMTVAYAAQDIQAAMGDRAFILGLGSQIKPHIRYRFSQSWPERPATAMREFVEALRAIWATWNRGAELSYRSEYYSHTLMSPMFTPPSTPRDPEVWVAAVGPGMTRVTGQVADGLLCHAFTTKTYLQQTTLPALQEGIARVEGRSRSDVAVTLPSFVVTGYDDDTREGMRQMVLQQIGFYGSTPAYRPVLEAHAWGELGEELHELSVSGGWAEMPDRIGEEVLEAFAVSAEPDELGDALVERFGGLVDRISLPAEIALTDEHLAKLRATLAAA